MGGGGGGGGGGGVEYNDAKRPLNRDKKVMVQVATISNTKK